jgi:sugar phosphate isomerase/epimerase
MDIPEHQILEEEIAATREELAILQKAVRDEGVTIVGQRGSKIAHPALAAIARHRRLLKELLKQMDSPETVTQQARRAARARWDKRKGSHPVVDYEHRVYVPSE